MSEEVLDAIHRDTGADPAFAVIWLHGLGADGHDFEPIVPQLGLSDSVPVRFVFPHAPMQPVTINGGMVMRAWYDITDMDLGSAVDADGIDRSSSHLRRLVETTVDSGIPAARIVLAGFSQGGVVALHTGLQYPERLAGIMALSTYVALPDALRDSASDCNRELPVFMAHGRYDPVIPCALGERGRDFLVNEGYQVQWREYPMEHAVYPDEIRDLAHWLKARITALTRPGSSGDRATAS